MATLEEGIVSLYNSNFSGFAFGYMKDYETNQTYASYGATGQILNYAGIQVSTNCLYRN